MHILKKILGYTNYCLYRLKIFIQPTIGAVKKKILQIADSYKVSNPKVVYGEKYYEKRKHDPRRSDARQVARVLDDKYSPKSIIDFGCAVGHYIEYFHEKNKKVRGLEGNPKALEHAVIPESRIRIFDLRNPYEPGQRFDLAICFEVAEHLAESHASTLVESLAKAADTIVFTAATPGQGGHHHVNEQPREYWIAKFEAVGFEYRDVDIKKVQNSLSLNRVTEISENLFLFEKKK